MTLAEISADYAAEALRLRGRLRELRKAFRAADDPIERGRLRVEISQLTRIQAQCYELAELCRHYYDAGFYRSPRFTLQEV